MGAVGWHGMARLGRRFAVVALLDVAIVVGLAAHAASGIASGAGPASFAQADPVRLLGATLNDVPCPSGPLAVGDGRMVVCAHWTAVVSPANKVEVVSVYGPGNPVVDTYDGPLPAGLAWGDEIAQAWSGLGRPNRITSVFGSPTLVYFFNHEPYGSLELRFDDEEHLIRVNASLVH